MRDKDIFNFVHNNRSKHPTVYLQKVVNVGDLCGKPYKIQKPIRVYCVQFALIGY